MPEKAPHNGHPQVTFLRLLPPEMKAKMWLYHYQDNVIANFDEWNSKAISDGFRGFVKTGAIFSRSYDKQEGGFVGSLRNTAIERLAAIKPTIKQLITECVALCDEGFSGDELQETIITKAKELGLL